MNLWIGVVTKCRITKRRTHKMSNHIMSNHKMSKNKMSNSQNVELTKCRIHIMSNAQHVEFTKCRILIKCRIFSKWRIFVSQHMWFDIYKMSNFCLKSNICNFATIFLCICLVKLIEYQGKSNGRIFICVSLSIKVMMHICNCWMFNKYIIYIYHIYLFYYT